MDELAILDELEDVVYLTDPDTYEVYFINRAGLKNSPIKEYKGLPCYKILQGKEHPCEFCTNKILNEKQFLVWEHYNDNLQRHFILKDKMIKLNGKKLKMEIAVDITEKEVISTQLAKKLESREKLVECIQIFSECTDFDAGMHQVLKNLAEYYQAAGAQLFETEASAITKSYAWYDDGEAKAFSKADANAYKCLFAACDSKGKLMIDNVDKTDSEVKKLCMKYNVSALMMVELHKEGKTLGYIMIINPMLRPGFDRSLFNSLVTFIEAELDRQHVHKHFEFLGYHDGLTGFNNRNRYMDHILQLNDVKLKSLGILYCDINDLKHINDSRGHDIGDLAILRFSKILSEYFNQRDLFRLGGDEFVVNAQNLDIRDFRERIRSIQMQIETHESFSVSMGYAWSETNFNIRELTRQADEMMYLNKQHYYENSEKDDYRHYSYIRQDLIKSIEMGSFVVYLQPKVYASDGRIYGAEALVRYQHEKHGLIPPGHFIYLLERERIIEVLDLYVLKQACLILNQWREEGIKLIPISVNFSRLTIADDKILEKMLKIVDEHAIEHSLIEIEITESTDMLDRELMGIITRQIREQGFLLSLDDFGSNYTNLASLTEVDMNVLKLDKSLVDGICQDHVSKSVVKSVIDFCAEMNITSLSEGVEMKEQVELLVQLGCNLIQGYYYGRPAPVEAFTQQWLK